MAQENFIGLAPLARTAGGTILRGQALTINAAGNVIATTAITEAVAGVALEDAVSGTQCLFMPSGPVVTAIGGAAITVGAQVMPQATGPGKFVTAAGTTAVSCGIALSNPGADNGLFELMLIPTLRSPANA
jgi:hypothetical protein